MEKLIKRLEALGNAGIVISIAYGPTSKNRVIYTVECLHDLTKETFDRPFVANNFEHCIEIAEIECRERRWIK